MPPLLFTVPIERPKTSRALQAKLVRKRALIRTLIEKAHGAAAAPEMLASAGSPESPALSQFEPLVGSTRPFRIQPADRASIRLAEIIPFPVARSHREG